MACSGRTRREWERKYAETKNKTRTETSKNENENEKGNKQKWKTKQKAEVEEKEEAGKELQTGYEKGQKITELENGD